MVLERFKNETLKNVRNHIHDNEKDDFEYLAVTQHYGGQTDYISTNLIAPLRPLAKQYYCNPIMLMPLFIEVLRCYTCKIGNMRSWT